jgi:hypothetical protein
MQAGLASAGWLRIRLVQAIEAMAAAPSIIVRQIMFVAPFAEMRRWSCAIGRAGAANGSKRHDWNDYKFARQNRRQKVAPFAMFWSFFPLRV